MLALKVGWHNNNEASYLFFTRAALYATSTKYAICIFVTVYTYLQRKREIDTGRDPEETARRELFVDWARKALPAQDLQRVQKIDQRYRATARKLGMITAEPVSEKKIAEAKERLGLAKKGAPPSFTSFWK